MNCSDKKNLLQTVALLRAYGFCEVVVCPGSRNAPFAQTFAACADFKCYAMTDERSAGFFALGRALQTGRPVAVCCTSGSALLNLHPAVCEAYYQRVPLLVISADRPAAWIGQMDGQTLPQAGVFGSLVKKSVNLPEIRTEEDEWYVNRLVNEALLELDHHGCGPVHINVPLSEPLFSFSTESLPEVRRIRRVERGSGENSLMSFLTEELPHYPRCLVVTGQMAEAEAHEVSKSLQEGKMAWLTEVLGNCPASLRAVRRFDTLLYAASEADLQDIRPDLVITLGGHIVSKRLKKYLRRIRPLAHWHVCPDGQVADLFCALTTVIEAPAADFCRILLQADVERKEDYARLWYRQCNALNQPQVAYSELTAVRQLVGRLPAGSVLHLANSSVVRLAELFPLPDGVTVECNRGVNGIEGSMSAAIGYAAASDRLNVLLIGDLSFFYDMNALWNGHIHHNLRIAVLNNGAGAIFHALPGLDMADATRKLVTATHEASAEGWARTRGMIYLKVTDEAGLESALASFYDEKRQAPVLLEIFTDPAADAAEQRRYYHRIKEEWNS